MTRATYKETYDAAVAAGFSPAVAPLVVAIGVAESGLIIDNVGDIDNPRQGCRSYGVMQINVCPGRESGALFNPASLVTLDGNMRAAFERSGHGRSFNPWTTFRKGTYLPFMAAAQHVAGGGTDISAGPASTSGGGTAEAAGFGLPGLPGLSLPGLPSWLNPGNAISSASDALLKGVGGLLLRGVLIAGGATLVVLGAYRAASPTIAKGRDTAGKLAPLAAAVA
jgi:Lysozyme like domain